MIHKNGGDAQRQDLVRTPAREEFDADDAVYVELPNVFFQRFQIGIGAEYILQHFERAPLRLGHDAADEIDIVVCRNQRNGGKNQDFYLQSLSPLHDLPHHMEVQLHLLPSPKQDAMPETPEK